MAQRLKAVPENAPGDFFVDSTCIDCEACRQLAPLLFGDHRGQSFLLRQPAGDSEQLQAAKALVACPTSSIGNSGKGSAGFARAAARAFPEVIEGSVHDCGYHAESSYGASSYLIVREGGNVLVDSPRAARPLLERLEQLGGVKTLFLTHRDDVADHQALHDRFGCERILHRADVAAGTRAVERKLEGEGPVALGEDLLAIPVPGHTEGSLALLFQGRFLFTGDHLWWDEERRRLHASRGVAWYDFDAQLASLEKLLAFDFEWVLPGHGRRHRARSAAEMKRALASAITRLRGPVGSA
jgi:glyoxylase-like metal-dependent hydrolase (beta-lactamase superfamily II)/ferredoxin